MKYIMLNNSHRIKAITDIKIVSKEEFLEFDGLTLLLV